MEVFHEGLSDDAPILIKEADKLREDGLAALGNNSPLPSEVVVSCAKKLALAFSSVARCNYRPDYTPPTLLAVAALQTVLSQFEQFPSLTETLRPDPFNRTAYQLLQDWAIDVSKMPDFKTLGETQRKAYSSSIQEIGAKTLIAVEKCGADAIEDIDSPTGSPEDSGPTRVDSCLAAIALACKIGPFSTSMATSAAQFSFLGPQMAEAYNKLIDAPEKVSEEREEVLSRPPQMAKTPEVPRPVRAPEPVPVPATHTR